MLLGRKPSMRLLRRLLYISAKLSRSAGRDYLLQHTPRWLASQGPKTFIHRTKKVSADHRCRVS
jgi:hypothetical protein